MRLALLFISAFCFLLSAFAETPPHPANAQIQAIVNQVNADTLCATIQRLTEFHTRHTYSDTTSDTVGIGAAMRWVLAKAQSYNASRFQFEEFPYAQNWNGQSVTRNNLICHLSGDSARYMIGGHLDSRAADISDVTGFAPGGDDNGSSCAALLELLRLLPDSLTHQLDVVWFSGEEQGLYGSAALAQHMAETQQRLDGMVCMDMIGHIVLAGGAIDSSSVRLYADGLASQGGTTSSSRNFQRYLRWVGESYVPDFDMHLYAASDRPGRGSDHLSFSAAGFPALRVIERNEDLAYQHGPNDVVQNMSCSYARKAAIVTFGGLLTMLKAPSRPASPLLEWENAHLLHITIPDSIALPSGGHFFLSIRNYLSTDFDSIADLGTGRSFEYTISTPTDIFCFSVSRSNADGLPSPFSQEIQSTEAAVEPSHVGLPEQVRLEASPNPFNSTVSLEFDLPAEQLVGLSIYDITGRQVANLLHESKPAGTWRAVWTPDHAATGIYFARLIAGYSVYTRKILYLR